MASELSRRNAAMNVDIQETYNAPGWVVADLKLHPGSGRLLVVDDNALNREVLEQYLLRQGHSVTTAENGNQALAMLEANEFDLVLLDIVMPHMDGFQVLQQLKTDHKLHRIPVIMLSAAEDMDIVVRCIETGADDYLPKPVNQVLLQAKIGASLERNRFRDQEVSYIRRISSANTELEKRVEERVEELKGSNQKLRVEVAERKRLEAQLTATMAEMVLVDQVAKIITSTLEPDEVFERFALEVKRLVDFDRANINIIDQEVKTFQVKYLFGESVPGRGTGAIRSLDNTQTHWVVQRCESLNREDIAADPRFPADKDYARTGLRSSIAVPLISKGRAIGVLCLRSHKVGAYGQGEQAILERLTSQIGPAVENANLYQKILESEKALREHTEDLARSNTELEQFAYVASHDLQEPLRSIAGFARLLAQRYHGDLDEKADHYLTRITNATARLQQLIRDLLMYSRVGRDVNDSSMVNCDDLIQQELASLQAVVEESGVTVSWDPLPIVRADPTLLGQVLRNLVSNAIKFRSDQAPCIHISAAQEGQEWLFSVRDNGIGIEAESADRIFIIFHRLHTREDYPGTGIGLAVCKKAVERWSGRIWVQSQPGKGSTFYFTVPIACNEGQSVAGPTPSPVT